MELERDLRRRLLGLDAKRLATRQIFDCLVMDLHLKQVEFCTKCNHMSKPSKPKTVDERLAEIRERLAEARRMRGWTQMTVAEAMGLSNSQYSRLESGSAEMTLHQFLVACEEVDLDPAVVLGAPQQQRVADLKARLSASETKLAAIARMLKSDKDIWDK